MIYVLDILEVQPGFIREVQARVNEVYRPLVGAIGMSLSRTWIAPAMEVVDRSSELLLLWELRDVKGYWRMRLRSGGDARVVAFWQDLERFLAGRTRRLMCDPDDESVVR